MSKRKQAPFKGMSWTRLDVGLCVSHVPERKQVALCHVVGNTFTPLAYFNTRKQAAMAMTAITHLVRS